jgi:hypothetical protein
MATYLPPGWPAGVHPPGSQDFERTAVAWLLDVVPPDYRLYGVLRRHPAALASLARHHLAACVEGARQGYRTARTELGSALPPHGVDAVLAAYRSEGRRLVAVATAVGLVERALRGETFTPRLRDSRPGRGADGPGANHGRTASNGAAGSRATSNGATGSGSAGSGAAGSGAATGSRRAGSNGAAARGAVNGVPATSGAQAASNRGTSSTTAGEDIAGGQESGTAKRASNGKAAGQGKRAKNGTTASTGKGRKLATASDGR